MWASWWTSAKWNKNTPKIMLIFLFFSVLTPVRWIAMTFGIDIHIPLQMNCNNIGDLLAINLAPSSGQNVSLSETK